MKMHPSGAFFFFFLNSGHISQEDSEICTISLHTTVNMSTIWYFIHNSQWIQATLSPGEAIMQQHKREFEDATREGQYL